MKNFLVPIDFSETSINAAKYAIGLTKDIPETHVTLYHVYNKSSFATLSSKDIESRQTISEEALQEVIIKINTGNSNHISVFAEEGSFLENITDYVMGNHIDLVIMGIKGSSRINQMFMGTNTLNVTRHISCPVMIVPSEANYSGFKHGVFISDYKDVARTTPFATLQNVMDTFKPELDILNVDSEHYVELTDEFKLERVAMEDKLGKYGPNFSFLRAYDVLEGVNSYVETKQIDMIISVPRKHNYLSQLFKTSHTKKLAYHGTVPILAIPA